VVLLVAAWKELRRGHPVAARLPEPAPGMVAYIMVIPRVRHFFESHAGRSVRDWVVVDSRILAFGTYALSDNQGYEIRYLRHRDRYTETDWGFDYDLVLDDETTRVKREMVERREEIPAALRKWLTDGSGFLPATRFDSALVNSFLDSYLNRPKRDRPHLSYPD
jgi:hypothetical protein